MFSTEKLLYLKIQLFNRRDLFISLFWCIFILVV